MPRSLIYNESYRILTNMLSMCSLMYQRGIVDANCFCDPLETRALADRAEEEHYTTLKLIIEYKVHTLDERQYLNILRAYASNDNLHHFRNFTITGRPELISASCTLMDYCYRIGVKKTTIYDRTRISNMFKTVRVGGYNYLTPKGELKEQAWFDEVRKYITTIELERIANNIDSEKIGKLDEFFAQIMKTRNELRTTEEIENARRSFILSGGSI